MLMFWSLGERPLRQALVLSGSSIYTPGFEVPANLPTTGLAFSEAGFGLVLLAPPSAAALLIRSSIIGGWDRLEDLWRELENWFVDVAETHTSRPAPVFFRSPHWEHSW